MKLKNSYSNVKKKDFLGIVFLIIIFILIDIYILYTGLNTNLSFLYDTNFISILLVLILLLMPLWLIFCLRAAKREHEFDKDFSTYGDSYIDYIEFTNNYLFIKYISGYELKCDYNKIYKMELTIDTVLGHSQGRYVSTTFPAIQGTKINICFGENDLTDSIFIYCMGTDLNKICDIVFYSQFIKDFSLKFSGTCKDEIEKKSKNIIENFIKSDYKKSFWLNIYLKLFSSINPIIVSIIFLIIPISFVLFFISLLK